jgi:hypothetical protein
MNQQNADLTYYSDIQRHLVCVPYTIENLHRMANELQIKRCWFHNKKSKEHYDIPKRRITEIHSKTNVVEPQTILAIIKGEFR